MSKYKGEGHSTTFNYGIQQVLRRKMSKGKLLELVSLGKDMRALVLFEGDNLIATKCFCLPYDKSARADAEASALRDYNFYKLYLMKGALVSFDAIDLL